MVTIRDVARKAGVALATASYVLNDKGRISAETRSRVLAVAEELGYVPNLNARSTKTGITNLLGILLRDTGHPLALKLIEGIDRTALEEQYNVIFCLTQGDPEREAKALELLLARQVAGLIVVDWRVKESRDLATFKGNLPLVYTNHRTYQGPSGSVLIDNVQGGYKATKHLLELGHRHIAYLGGPPGRSANEERLIGYKRALDEAGVAAHESLIVMNERFRFEYGLRAMERFIDSNIPMTALVAANDELAMGAITACHNRGIRIPQDLAVVGFDNTDMGRRFHPPLTSVGLPLEEVGRVAVRLLIDEINGKDGIDNVVHIPCPLIVRSSCGSPR